MYLVQTKDFYDDVLRKPGFLEQLDTSNFPSTHPCFRIERKKVPGTFTDETGGKSIWEQVALRAKSYGFSLTGEEIIKAKGVSRTNGKNKLTLEDHKRCLFQDLGINEQNRNYSAYRDMSSFRSFHHEIKTVSMTKLALNREDNKRIVLEDQIHTIAYGHYKIEYV